MLLTIIFLIVNIIFREIFYVSYLIEGLSLENVFPTSYYFDAITLFIHVFFLLAINVYIAKW